MIVLIGESGCGKSTIERKLVELGYTRAISHTSRPIRISDGEIDGINYFYRTKEQMIQLNKEGKFAEYIPYLGNYYALHVDECKNDRVVVVEPLGLKQLKEKDFLDITAFYLHASEQTRRDRMVARGDSLDNINTRLENDKKVFDGVTELVEYVIQTDNKTIDTIVEEIFTKL